MSLPGAKQSSAHASGRLAGAGGGVYRWSRLIARLPDNRRMTPRVEREAVAPARHLPNKDIADVRQSSEPILNVPAVITLLVALFLCVHGVRWFLSERGDIEFLLLFAFIPARYDADVLAQGAAPGGLGADIWTFVTYAFIHGDLTHLTVNALWLLVFGSALAVRFGALKLLAFFLVTSAAGALAHLASHPGTFTPMVGASAAISGATAGVIRFLFEPGGPLGANRLPAPAAQQVPASPLLVTLSRPPVLIFVAVWLGLNLLLGLGTIPVAGEGASVAWEAHIGGFVAGLLLFSLFDPIRQRPA